MMSRIHYKDSHDNNILGDGSDYTKTGSEVRDRQPACSLVRTSYYVEESSDGVRQVVNIRLNVERRGREYATDAV
jgi:hypothetical protein